jgi:hypothetical protein
MQRIRLPVGAAGDRLGGGRSTSDRHRRAKKASTSSR